MVYKFRAILDAEDDIFRDIAILSTDTLEDFHNALVNAFGFDGNEMASFYTCDAKWNQDEEISLFDSGEDDGAQAMATFQLADLLDKDRTKIIYVYDFLNMWTFLVELAAVEDVVAGEVYPSTLFSHGIMPDNAPENNFEADDLTESYNEFEDELDEDDLDGFSDGENFEDFGFEENWN